MKRILLASVAALVLGIGLATFLPGLADKVRSVAGMVRPAQPEKDGHGHDGGGHDHQPGQGEDHAGEGMIHLTEQQIAAAKIEVAKVASGTLSHGIPVAGTITANAETLSFIPASVGGILRELRRQLGEPVARGDVLAVIESREIADSKSEYLAALRNQALAQTTLRREESLWKERISAEREVIQARATAEEARIRVDLARQKLAAIGIDQAQISRLPQRDVALLRFFEVRSPLAGRVIARPAELGSSVETNTALFTVADLSSVWVELAVSPLDMTAMREGMTVTVRSGANGASGRSGEAKLIFVSPVVNNETRTARAVASLANAEMRWRPGDYVQAVVETGNQPVAVMVPRSALQTIAGEQVVFVRNAEGFEKREVELGRGTDQSVEVTFGLDAGETIAVTNSFVLNAELGKAEAEHVH